MHGGKKERKRDRIVGSFYNGDKKRWGRKINKYPKGTRVSPVHCGIEFTPTTKEISKAPTLCSTQVKASLSFLFHVLRNLIMG